MEKQLSVPISRGVQICKKTMVVVVVVGRALHRSHALRESIANHMLSLPSHTPLFLLSPSRSQPTPQTNSRRPLDVTR